MPPFVPNTSGVKVPISTSITLWLYFLFFSFSCSLKIVAVYLPWLDRELTCVTRTSKNAVTPGVQKPPAFVSSLVSRLVTVDWRLNTSLSSGRRSGSVSTFLHTVLMCDVRRSRIDDFSHSSAPKSPAFSYIMPLSWRIHAWLVRLNGSLICVNVRPFLPMVLLRGSVFDFATVLLESWPWLVHFQYTIIT